MKIWGEYVIKNGDRIIKAKNKLLDALAENFAKVYGAGTTAFGMVYQDDYNIKVGTDTSTHTALTMTDLVSKIDTDPDSKSNGYSQAGVGHWVFSITATWNAGTLNNGITIGEVGVWVASASTSSQNYLASRLSSADGEFQALTLDNTKPLTIVWQLHFDFTS